jgi:hypothetical protein
MDGLSIWLIAFASLFAWCYIVPYAVHSIKQCLYGPRSDSIIEADCVVINSDEITYADAVILSIESYEQEEHRRNQNSPSNIDEKDDGGDNGTNNERATSNDSDDVKNVNSNYTTNALVEARWVDVCID